MNSLNKTTGSAGSAGCHSRSTDAAEGDHVTLRAGAWQEQLHVNTGMATDQNGIASSMSRGICHVCRAQDVLLGQNFAVGGAAPVARHIHIHMSYTVARTQGNSAWNR